MRYLILTLSLIIGLATSVSANDKPFAVGDVFFCQMEEYVVWEWSDKKLEQFKKEKFKFTIADSEKIKFGEGGKFFKNFEMSLVAFSGRKLIAESTVAKMWLVGSKFSLAVTSAETIIMAPATCDRF